MLSAILVLGARGVASADTTYCYPGTNSCRTTYTDGTSPRPINIPGQTPPERRGQTVLPRTPIGIRGRTLARRLTRTERGRTRITTPTRTRARHDTRMARRQLLIVIRGPIRHARHIRTAQREAATPTRISVSLLADRYRLGRAALLSLRIRQASSYPGASSILGPVAVAVHVGAGEAKMPRSNRETGDPRITGPTLSCARA